MTVMVKMPAGYDPENNDWWYARVDSSGTIINDGGKLEECMSCHQGAVDQDYLFSDLVMETIRESGDFVEQQ